MGRADGISLRPRRPFNSIDADQSRRDDVHLSASARGPSPDPAPDPSPLVPRGEGRIRVRPTSLEERAGEGAAPRG